MNAHLIIPVDIYNCTFHIFYNRKVYNRWEKKIIKGEESKIPKHWDSFFLRIFKKQDNGLHTLYRVLCIDTDELFLAANHESIHAVFDLFDDIKIPFKYENSEVFAYMTGYLAEKIIDYGLLYMVEEAKKLNEKV